MSVRRSSGLHHPSAVYAKQVTQGKLRPQCCRYEILACQRHLDDLKRQGTKDFPYVFDTTRADRIIRWFGECRQVRGVEQGEPITLEPWQIFDLSVVYGWVHKDTGARRFKRTYEKRARGNFKSTEKSGQGLYHMCADVIYPPYKPEEAKFEMEPEVECAAVDRGQAMRVFGDAKAIAQVSPNIERRLIIPRSNPVRHRTRGGYMRALSKDTKNKDAGAPSCFILDEYHAHPTSLIYDLGLSSFGKRPQSLMCVITTAGDDAENKPCYDEEVYAKSILDDPSIHDETYFVMIRELDADDDPHDEQNWLKANPCLRYPNDYSMYLLEQIRAEYTAAYSSNNAEKIRQFLTRRCCMWQTGSVNRYLDEQDMQLVKEAMVSPSWFAALTDGRGYYGGYDLGKRVDLTGAAAAFLLDDGYVAVEMHGFMPEEGLGRHEHTDRYPYREWCRDGYCTATPGAVTENQFVSEWFRANEKAHGWKAVKFGYDGHNATDLAISMTQAWGDPDICVEIFQGCGSQNIAVKGFRDLLRQKKLIIKYSPAAVKWLANAVEYSNGNDESRISKKYKDDTSRVDPVAACMDALVPALLRKNNPTLTDRINSGKWSM